MGASRASLFHNLCNGGRAVFERHPSRRSTMTVAGQVNQNCVYAVEVLQNVPPYPGVDPNRVQKDDRCAVIRSMDFEIQQIDLGVGKRVARLEGCAE